MNRRRALVAGVAGASLGTEIIKCLKHAGDYEILACDISNMAQGLYEADMVGSFIVDEAHYVEDLMSLCELHRVDVVIPGGEKPMLLLSNAQVQFESRGIQLAVNNASTIKVCADKYRCFALLEKEGVKVPLTANADNFEAVFPRDMPCVVKPSTGSGGSAFVFLARNRLEAAAYVDYLLRNDQVPIVQEYVSDADGEFTVGTLTLDSNCGSVALKRSFKSKLSVLHRSSFGVISSGYSQGEIGDFSTVRKVSEKIAIALGSTGPLNVQGRMRNQEFIPFEVNPRFSTTTFLRTLAGWNEVDLFLKYKAFGSTSLPNSVRSGFYFRSMSEQYVPYTDLK